ncbi:MULTISPECIES: hypothetical protein [unclassified Streptomyces]|uniref:hypothetical protein n=1 Tax=unclassified Streptomyces TaxID=2593676 RepID=UPI000C6F1957|nr:MULTISPECIES: hypothetical protein [unclassified Streptomyces]
MFYGAGHQQVYEALRDFWEAEDYRLADASPVEDAFTLHQTRDAWTALNWTRGWEWDLRRRAQFHVSGVLDCPGLLTFMYDGDNWGYELFHHGTPIDQFLQWAVPGQQYFSSGSVQGNPALVVAQFPMLNLDLDHARGYLTSVDVADPAYEDFDFESDDPRNRRVRAGDWWGRLEAEVMFDFWRFLGVEPAPPDGKYLFPAPGLFEAPAWRRFTTQRAELL